MENIATYLGCGIYEARSKNIKAGNLVVSKISDLTEKIIPFYDKYSIMGCKSQDFSDFKRVSELVLKKAHLTVEGLNLIKKNKIRNEFTAAGLIINSILTIFRF